MKLHYSCKSAQVAPGLSRLSQNATFKQTNIHQRMTYAQVPSECLDPYMA